METVVMGLYLLLINIITLALYAIDKLNAKTDSWRISERMLIMFAVAGGSIGALLGMYICRHKTRKPKFKFGIPVILVLQIVLVIYLVYM
jgi:uncharacterized membrane protein YsdA (DUF1294 family)